MSGWISLPFMLLLFLPQSSVADAPETIAHALIRHHVELSRPALLEALRNSDKEVRALAAWQLVDMKAIDSLPEILQAMRAERDPDTKVNLASAALDFRAKEGTVELKAACRDSSLPGSARLAATRYLFRNKDRSCMPDLLRMTSAEDSGTQELALSLISQRHDLTNLESEQVMRVCLMMLLEGEPHKRLKAATFLGNLGNTEAIPYMRQAISIEHEQGIRFEMQRSLDYLLAQKTATKK